MELQQQVELDHTIKWRVYLINTYILSIKLEGETNSSQLFLWKGNADIPASERWLVNTEI